MQILFANWCSLLTKFTELTFLLPTTQPSIICLTDAWLTSSVSDPEISLDGNSLFSKWPYSAPSRRWSGYVGKIVPHAYSPCDRYDQPTSWNGGLSIFPSLTSYHGVTRLQKPIISRIRSAENPNIMRSEMVIVRMPHCDTEGRNSYNYLRDFYQIDFVHWKAYTSMWLGIDTTIQMQRFSFFDYAYISP